MCDIQRLRKQQLFPWMDILFYFLRGTPRESLTLFIRGGIVMGVLINTSKTARDNLR